MGDEVSPGKVIEGDKSMEEGENIGGNGKNLTQELEYHLLSYKEQINEIIIVSRVKGSQQLAIKVGEIYRKMMINFPIVSKDECPGCIFLQNDIKEVKVKNSALETKNKELIAICREREKSQLVLEQKFEKLSRNIEEETREIRKEREIHQKRYQEMEEKTLRYEKETREIVLKKQLESKKDDKMEEKIISIEKKTDILLNTMKIGKQQQQEKPKVEIPTLVIDTTAVEGANTYRDVLRKNLKELTDTKPIDVRIVKPNRLVLKMENKEELKNLAEKIEKNEKMLNLGSVRIIKELKNKLILFGIPEEIGENELMEELKSLEELKSREIRILKFFKGRKDILHAIIQVDNYTREILLKKKRILVDLVPVRIGEYKEIKRCYRCQSYGHLSYDCKQEIKCAICQGQHDTRTCTETEATCCYCKENNNHRSDSFQCQYYIEQKMRILKPSNE